MGRLGLTGAALKPLVTAMPHGLGSRWIGHSSTASCSNTRAHWAYRLFSPVASLMFYLPLGGHVASPAIKGFGTVISPSMPPDGVADWLVS